MRIKICGVTNSKDAFTALEAGADAIGLNFYEKSCRYIDVETARSISDSMYSLPASHFGHLVYAIGVFVNHSESAVERIFKEARLVAAQLHGNEPPKFLSSREDIPPIRVYRLGERGLSAVAEQIAACPRPPESVLIDSATPGEFGGTGKTVAWHALADHRRWLGETPLILAGGLTPENVAEAIRIVRPHAVDVASGVESSPGKKDPAKVRDFVAAAHEAFEQIGS